MPIDLARTPRTLPAHPPPDPELQAATRTILQRSDVQAVLSGIREGDARTLDEQLRLASTPAPPFKEEARGLLFADLLEASGTDRPWVDAEGNVLAWLGPEGSAPLVVGAHLDTVFPSSQEITIERQGDRWVGPGICDDARGLAVLLALVRALAGLHRTPDYPLLFVGTVGEEGMGNLRGVRHLFGEGGAVAGARGFISLDGAGVGRVIASGVGSRRFRATVRGPGGHSWVDWGRVNPIHILARAVSGFQEIALPEGTTMSVGRVEGGTSVNAIPTGAWIEFETRSEMEPHLASMEARLTGALQAAVAEANRGADPGQLAALEVEPVGNRPAGTTSADTPLVRSAVAATREVTGSAELAASSTDANFPMSVGVPAITLGAGGEAGEAHTPREWYRNEQGPEGTIRALLTLLTLEQVGA